MPTVQRFEDLRVWQEARGIVGDVYRLAAHLPSNELYGLSSQMQRAAVSVMSNIAEGFERETNKEFIRFLYIAKGSVGEVRSQLYVALDLGYVPEATCRELAARCETLSRRLHRFIEQLKTHPSRGDRLREPGPIWHTDEPETYEPEP
jgi:four helix bundle protein